MDDLDSLREFDEDEDDLDVEPVEDTSHLFFEVDTSNKYVIKHKRIADITEVGETFHTYDELRALLGDKGHIDKHYGGTYTRSQQVEIQLRMWLKRLQKSTVIVRGAQTITITDNDLVEVLDASEWQFRIKDRLRGARRDGNQLFFKAPKPRKANRNDAMSLIRFAIDVINKQIKCHIVLQHIIRDRKGAFSIVQKLLTWEQVEEAWTKWRKDQLVMLPIYKHIWENTDKFD